MKTSAALDLRNCQSSTLVFTCATQVVGARIGKQVCEFDGQVILGSTLTNFTKQ